MKRFLGVLALCVAVVWGSSCSNIKSKKVTDANKDRVLGEISTSKDLTDEEKQLLVAYAMRQSLSAVFQGGKPGLPSGKTIGEMIDEQRAWKVQQRQEEERQKKLAAEVAAKQAELRNVIGVALYSFTQKKGFMSDYIEAGYAYENRSDRDVRAFEGDVAYKDVLGNQLEETSLKVLTPIKAGQKAAVSDSLPFIAYPGLRDKKLEDVKIEWRPKKILFADGASAEVAGQ